jgi:hypothetical protein
LLKEYKSLAEELEIVSFAMLSIRNNARGRL